MYAEISILLSVILSILATELIGISGGGVVVPGYLALYLDQPWRIAVTFLSAGITIAVIKLLSGFIILYGRRRFTAALLIGILVDSAVFSQVALRFVPAFSSGELVDLRVIGYIIPGLIANEMMRQGILNTILMTLLLAIMIRIVLIYLHAGSWIGQL